MIGDFMKNKDISTLLAKATANNHSDYVKGYLELNMEDNQYPDLMLAYADSLYELGKDLEAIAAYLNYVLRHPQKKGVDFALFGAAMAFKNIGLEMEAIAILELIRPGHDNLKNEILESKQKIDIQIQAKDIFKKFKAENCSKAMRE